MNLLAMDIGGTNSRMAHCSIEPGQHYKIIDTFEFETGATTVNSFANLLEAFAAKSSNNFLAIDDYDAVGIAIAGPVIDNCAYPPNIRWTLNLSDHPQLPQTFLLNDFAAQAYALSSKNITDNLIPVRRKDNKGNVSAMIGAGTGLGHCLIVNYPDQQQVLPSEAGQANFSFNADEKDIHHYFLEELHARYITNDQVVSGPGLQMLHACITGQELTAAEICATPFKYEETLTLFSRFYARACRNFCLSACVTHDLILSGGIAAKHPALIDNDDFLNEFDDSSTHQHLLKNLSVYINPAENIGIEGVIIYSLSKLSLLNS